MSDALSLTALTRMTIAPSRDELVDDGPVCACCREPFVIPIGMEPTALCNPCAQTFVHEWAPGLLEIAVAAIAYHDTDKALTKLIAKPREHRDYNAITKADKAHSAACRRYLKALKCVRR